MVIEGSREYKAAQELERALNDYGWNPKRFAESTRYYHLSLIHIYVCSNRKG